MDGYVRLTARETQIMRRMFERIPDTPGADGWYNFKRGCWQTEMPEGVDGWAEILPQQEDYQAVYRRLIQDEGYSPDEAALKAFIDVEGAYDD